MSTSIPSVFRAFYTQELQATESAMKRLVRPEYKGIANDLESNGDIFHTLLEHQGRAKVGWDTDKDKLYLSITPENGKKLERYYLPKGFNQPGTFRCELQDLLSKIGVTKPAINATNARLLDPAAHSEYLHRNAITAPRIRTAAPTTTTQPVATQSLYQKYNGANSDPEEALKLALQTSLEESKQLTSAAPKAPPIVAPETNPFGKKWQTAPSQSTQEGVLIDFSEPVKPLAPAVKTTQLADWPATNPFGKNWKPAPAEPVGPVGQLKTTGTNPAAPGNPLASNTNRQLSASRQAALVPNDDFTTDLHTRLLSLAEPTRSNSLVRQEQLAHQKLQAKAAETKRLAKATPSQSTQAPKPVSKPVTDARKLLKTQHTILHTLLGNKQMAPKDIEQTADKLWSTCSSEQKAFIRNFNPQNNPLYIFPYFGQEIECNAEQITTLRLLNQSLKQRSYGLTS